MTWWAGLLLVLAVVAVLWAACVLWLYAAGRRTDARALATFIPDCIVLVARVLRDPRVPRRRKALLVGVTAYLAMPFDLVPDFIPVAGQLDDVIVVAIVVRHLVRTSGPGILRDNWPGPERSLDLLLRACRVSDFAIPA